MTKLRKLNILSAFNSFPLHKNVDNKGPINKSKKTGPDLECIGFPEWKVAAQANIMLYPKTPINGNLFKSNCRQTFKSPMRNTRLKTTQTQVEIVIKFSDCVPIAPNSLIVSLKWL